MRVLILNQTFYPDVAATAQHMWDLARYLKTAGHEVVAIASRNVYGSDQTAFAAHEVVEGVEIHRVGGTAMGKRSHLHRMADFLSFYIAAGWKLFRIKRPDAIIALTSPPMISALAAGVTMVRRAPSRRRIRFVYHVMDVYPEAAVASGMFRRGGLPDRLFSAITRATLRRADVIIALGRDMKQLLLDHYGKRACGDKIQVITPWADGKELFPIPKSENALAAELGLRDTFNVVYSGNFGVAHDVETVVKAIELTQGEEGLMWVFIGGGKRLKELEAQAAERKWKHVRFLPYQPRERLNEALNLADVHLVTQLPEFTGIVVPSKLFGIMAVGKPTIMVGPEDCEVSRVLSYCAAGVWLRNGDAEELASAITGCRKDASGCAAKGNNARAAFERDYGVLAACAQIARVVLGHPER